MNFTPRLLTETNEQSYFIAAVKAEAARSDAQAEANATAGSWLRKRTHNKARQEEVFYTGKVAANINDVVRHLSHRNIIVTGESVLRSVRAQVHAIRTYGYRPTYATGPGWGYYDVDANNGTGAFIGALIGAEVAMDMLADAAIVNEGYYSPVEVIEEGYAPDTVVVERTTESPWNNPGDYQAADTFGGGDYQQSDTSSNGGDYQPSDSFGGGFDQDQGGGGFSSSDSDF